MEHTPGPWNLTDEKDPLVYGPTGGYIAQVFAYDGNHFRTLRPNYAADARLIAAAPELLAALQWLLNDPSAERGAFTAITYAEEIIAKATGRAIGATK